jgi:nuclear RNA export factor
MGLGPVRVVSDMLSLRAFSPLPDVFGPSSQVAVASSDNSANSSHEAMIAELCKQTGMVPQYSEMCLSQVEWDFAKALVIFNEKRVGFIPVTRSRTYTLTDTDNLQAQLPPDAFAVPPQ